MSPMSSPDVPDWDMSAVYPTTAAPEIARDLNVLISKMQSLHANLDGPTEGRQGMLENILHDVDGVLRDGETLDAYFLCFELTGRTDASLQAHTLALAELRDCREALIARFEQWVQLLDVNGLRATSSMRAQRNAPVLAALQRRGSHWMTAAEESLAASLTTTGSAAWARLYGDISASLTIEVEVAIDQQFMVVNVLPEEWINDVRSSRVTGRR